MQFQLFPLCKYQDSETPLRSLLPGLSRIPRVAIAVAVSTVAVVGSVGRAARAQVPFSFSTGNVNNLMAMASRPSDGPKGEIEAADDFITSSATTITSASFIGLLPTGATISSVDVEIYGVFPQASTNPPDGAVPTRINSPSDNAFDERATTTAGQMSFTTTTLNSSFTALNSVLNGINPIPNQTTGGEGAVTGQEVQFNLTFTQPFVLPANHYFFVPQVDVAGTGNFFWLSSVRPIVSPGTAFAPDLQAWIRNGNLQPDWLRVGTDIVGGTTPPTFNGQFNLTGTAVAPEPSALALVASGLSIVAFAYRKRRIEAR